jgi:hypothetical protein
LEAGAPDDATSTFFTIDPRFPPRALLDLCGMNSAVEARRHALATVEGYYDGEGGPVPDWWNMPDFIAQWERDNPGIVAERKAEGEREAAREATSEGPCCVVIWTANPTSRHLTARYRPPCRLIVR